MNAFSSMEELIKNFDGKWETATKIQFGESIGNAGAVGLAAHLPKCTALQSLDVNGSDIADDGAVALSNGLAGLAALQTLILRGNLIGAKGAAALSSKFASLSALQDLFLNDNRLGDGGVVALSAKLAGLKALQKLYLGGNKIEATGADALSKGLEGLTALQELSLGINRIGDDGVLKLVKGLANLKALRKLSLHKNQIGVKGADALSNILAGLTSLRELYLNDNQIGDEGVAKLSKGLACLTGLQKFSLCNNNIGAEGAATLGTSLAGLTAMEELYLGDNRIGNDGTAALSGGLAGLVALKRLSIYGNRIGDDGAVVLSSVLAGLAELQSLNLSENQIGSKGALALCMGLEGLKEMRTLYLRNNKIGCEGAIAIAQVCAECKALKIVELSGSDLSAASETIAVQLLDAPGVKFSGVKCSLPALNVPNVKAVIPDTTIVYHLTKGVFSGMVEALDSIPFHEAKDTIRRLQSQQASLDYLSAKLTVLLEYLKDDNSVQYGTEYPRELDRAMHVYECCCLIARKAGLLYQVIKQCSSDVVSRWVADHQKKLTKAKEYLKHSDMVIAYHGIVQEQNIIQEMGNRQQNMIESYREYNETVGPLVSSSKVKTHFDAFNTILGQLATQQSLFNTDKDECERRRSELVNSGIDITPRGQRNAERAVKLYNQAEEAFVEIAGKLEDWESRSSQMSVELNQSLEKVLTNLRGVVRSKQESISAIIKTKVSQCQDVTSENDVFNTYNECMKICQDASTKHEQSEWIEALISQRVPCWQEVRQAIEESGVNDDLFESLKRLSAATPTLTEAEIKRFSEASVAFSKKVAVTVVHTKLSTAEAAALHASTRSDNLGDKPLDTWANNLGDGELRKENIKHVAPYLALLQRGLRRMPVYGGMAFRGEPGNTSAEKIVYRKSSFTTDINKAIAGSSERTLFVVPNLMGYNIRECSEYPDEKELQTEISNSFTVEVKFKAQEWSQSEYAKGIAQYREMLMSCIGLHIVIMFQN